MNRHAQGPGRCASVLLLALFAATAARADTIFSNFGPGYTDSGGAVSVAGSNVGGEYYSVAFTPTSNEILTDAITDLIWFGGQDTVSAFILADNSGVPGASIATLNQTTPISNGLETFTCTTCPELQAGTQYWLELQEEDPNTDIGWYVSTSDTPVDYNYVQGYTFYSSGMWWPTWDRNVFEIDGTPAGSQDPNGDPAGDPDPVPEPSTFALLLAGFVALIPIVARKILADSRC